jgi:hypothetical protein
MKLIILTFLICLGIGCSEKRFNNDSEAVSKTEAQENVKEVSKEKCLFSTMEINSLKKNLIESWRLHTHDMKEADLIDCGQTISAFVALEAIKITSGLPVLQDSDLKSLIENIQNTNIEKLDSLDIKSARKIFCF